MIGYVFLLAHTLIMQDSVSEQDIRKILVTLWARRKAKHEEIFQSPLSTFTFIQNYLAELDLVPAKQKAKPTTVVSTALRKWLKGLTWMLLSAKIQAWE